LFLLDHALTAAEVAALIADADSLLAGDANQDGTVNDADAAILAAHWQLTNATWTQGNFNGDGTVDSADASLLALNWQKSVPEREAQSVPEPSAIALACGGLLCLWLRRRFLA
ncbi:MAG: dockerin type I domain-containing protein, partial [Planctomycetia bacterium]|nr:dockerin type I domain-containing protein [Planctomycetia bacterium]